LTEDLALLAPFDRPLARPEERERLAADDAVFAAFFSIALTALVLDLAGDFAALTRAHFFGIGDARALDEGRFADADLGRPAGERLRAGAARFGVTLRALLFDEPEPEDVQGHGAMM